ncbi:MAG: 1-acyl-sn-glycerol-3-phosphate acyltransferase [Alphaproteobacteria bacterium]|nr:1-acyl-sn-glycerol-3-phosphate acyltransferase [Alphaproteobacteria bacterium]
MTHLRAAWSLVLIVAVTVVCLIAQIIVFYLRSPLSRQIPRLYHGLALKVIGLRVVHHGEIAAERPILFVANHSSWLDILVLNTLTTVSFVTKAEVRTWPLIGYFAVLQHSVFVERRAARTADTKDEITRRLEMGDRLVLFPEGTSSDGNRVLPFKSAFFAVAERPINGRPLLVQPVSVAYTALDGIPLGRQLRPIFTWFADMDLFSHLWGVMGAGPGTVEVQFHPPVTIEAFADRKALAKACEAQIAQGLSDSLSGRTRDPKPRRYWLVRPERRRRLDSKSAGVNVA